MANTVVKRFTYIGATETFTMPTGFKPQVDVYMWGAGGGAGGSDGNGPGGNGGGGWFYNNSLTINAGDTVTVAVGGSGKGGGGSSGGGAGAGGPSYAANTSWSTLDLMSNSDNLRVTNGAYVGFLNTYGVWNYSSSHPTFDQTVTVNFPYSGYYNVVGACDNYATVYVDGSPVLSIPGFQATYTNSFYVTAGNHSVRLYGVNTGGPASIGVTIQGAFRGGRGGNAGPHGWSGGGGGGGGSTVLVVNGTTYVAAGGGGGGGGSHNRSAESASNPTSISTGSSTGGDCGGDGGGGGGGGGAGGAGGGPGYDNAYGGRAGSAGSSSTGAVGADSNSAGGAGSAYYQAPAGQGGIGPGNAGAPGQVVLVLTPAGAGSVKVGTDWKPVNTLSVKVGGIWREVKASWIKLNGVWRQVSSNASSTSISTTVNTSNFG